MPDEQNGKYVAPWGEYESKEQADAAMVQYAAQLQAENARLQGVMQAQQQQPQPAPAPVAQPTNYASGKESDDYSHDKFLEEFVKGNPAHALDKIMKKEVFGNANLQGSFLQLMASNAAKLQQLESLVLTNQVKGQYPEIDIQNKGIQEEIKKIQQEKNLAPHQIDVAIELGQKSGRLPTREQYQAWVQSQVTGMVTQQQEQQAAQMAADNPMVNPQWQQQPPAARYQQPIPFQPRVPIAPPSIGNRGGFAPAVNQQEFLEKLNSLPTAEAKKYMEQMLGKVG